MRARSSLVAVLVGFACACAGQAAVTPVAPPSRSPAPVHAHPRPPPAAPLPPEPAEVKRWEALSQELATALRAAGAPCGAVEAAVRAFVERRRDEIWAAHQALVAWEASAPPRQIEAFHRRVFTATDVRIEAGVRCKGHPGAVAAYDRFFEAAGLDAR